MLEPATPVSLETLRGEVDAVYWSNATFSVGRLKASDGKNVSFAGAVTVRQGEPVVLRGTWEMHPKYGRQFKVASFAFDQDMSVSGLEKYLADHPEIVGIGPARARKIAQLFGADFDRIIADDPGRIAREAKIPKKSVDALRTVWLRTRDLNLTMTYLASLGLTNRQSQKLVEKFGEGAALRIQQDPYQLIREVPGFGFKRVDAMAQKAGIAVDSPSRVDAAVTFIVGERLQQGDCWVDREWLTTATLELLQLPGAARLVADAIRSSDILVEEEISGRAVIALAWMLKLERELAARFVAKPNVHFEGRALGAIDGTLNERQREAVIAATEQDLLLVSGGAGSGKTYTLSAIVKLYEAAEKLVILAAPTGKAAKRIEEVVGREASTLHRLLGFDGKEWTVERIDADVIIVDEVSMVDVPLAARFFRAVGPETAVVLVGDHNQLPPVGPGNILRDLIARRSIPTIILDRVVRQAGALKENSTAILDGVVRQSVGSDVIDSPWVVHDGLNDPFRAQERVVQLAASMLDRLGQRFLKDVQILAPQRKGPVGTETLNVELQRLVQDKLWGIQVQATPEGRRPRILVNDRVIQTRNNYKLETLGRDVVPVMNGTIGRVMSVDRGALLVRFDGVELDVKIEGEALNDLMLAYALTIHKSQGSEFPYTVLVVHKSQSFMHHRNLFYTGVTRARKTVHIVGDQWGIKNCAAKQQVDDRKTFLSVIPIGVPVA